MPPGPPLDDTAPPSLVTRPTGEGRQWGAFWAGPGGEAFFGRFADVTSLGRDATCAAVLSGEAVSRQHAVIRREGPLYVLTDEGSRNGTFLNGAAVQTAPLRPGDVLRIGGWLGVVSQAAAGTGAEFQRLPGGVILGPTLAEALAPALNAATHDLPVILEGETGTGKEVAARLIHERSGRQGDFVAVNCAAIPESLAEAELFGFRKGAFTGADQSRSGHFRAADGGTLLLDEVIDLPLAVQSKLLRVLEQREVLPLGESRPVKIDTRVIVAAQESLRQAVADRRFRGDLYARLNGMSVTLPPLRERREEVPPLFRSFLAVAAPGEPPALSPRLLERLCLHDWPFNVREAALLARRLRAAAPGESLLTSAHLPPELLRQPAGEERAPSPPRQADGDQPLSALTDALRSCRGNVSLAAARLGISRGKAYRLMKEGNVDPLETRWTHR
jgi:transcriptional regulator of acetoin/glycerol metabolism